MSAPTSGNQRTRFACYLNGTFIPCWAGTVELTAYGTADACSLTTFLNGQPDFGAISQSGKYLPLIVKIGTVGDSGLNVQLLAAYLDEIDTTYDKDEIEVHGRGILAPLIDKRLSTKVGQNITVGAAITQILKSVPGLKYKVATTSLKVGKALTKDQVSNVRNVRAMDYINQLANAAGWRVRVVGATVYVGPPALDGAPTLTKQWGGPSGGLKLSVKHNALHAHNIHVRVVSTVQGTKAKSRANAGPGSITATDSVTGKTAVFPIGVAPGKAKAKAQSTPTKNVAGVATGNVPTVSDVEEYTFSIPGLTQDQCNIHATGIQEEISRHEFVAELEWAPTPDEIKFLAANGVEWLLQLTGCSQQSHNQTYHPKRINWTYAQDGGLLVNVLAINHLLPQGAEAES